MQNGTNTTWQDFREKVDELSQKSQPQVKGQPRASNEISVLSWRKFKRIVNKATKNDDMFANRANASNHECRLADAIKHIASSDVYVIDIAKLPEDKQAFVFGDAVRTIYNLKLGEYDSEHGVDPPSRIIVFIDELFIPPPSEKLQNTVSLICQTISYIILRINRKNYIIE